jgi:ribosomal protein S18 acetylase RimI-like enzyme
VADNDLRWEARSVSATASPDGLVRDATTADAREIAAVHVATWQDAYAGLLPADFLAGLDVKQRAENWHKRISDPPDRGFVLVYERLGRVRGFVSGGPSRDGAARAGGPSEIGEVYAIYVDPACQGQGAGTRLLEAAARWLAEAGFNEASLWVLAENHSSRRFYESCGWRGDGTMKPFDYGEGQSIPEVRYITRLTIPAG